MAVSAFESAWAGPHLGCPETAALFSDAAEVAAMVRVEAALARVQGRSGDPRGGRRGDRAGARRGGGRPGGARARTAGSGIPVPALVAALRAIVGGEAAPYIHWGATTQDIVDTGLVLRLRDLCGLLGKRLEAVIATLAGQAQAQATW